MVSAVSGSSAGYYAAQAKSQTASAKKQQEQQDKPPLRVGTDADREAFAAQADPEFLEQKLKQMNDFLATLGLPPEENYVAASKRCGGLTTEELERYTTHFQTTREARMRNGLDPEGKAITGEITFSETLTASTPGGLQVSVTPGDGSYDVVVSRDGKKLSQFTSSNDVRITEKEDGSFVVTRFSDATLNGTAGDDIIISRIAARVNGGEGNDIIFALGNGEYHGDSGNDSILLGPASGASVFAGDGDDAVIGNRINDAAIDLGEGNNMFRAAQVRQSTVRAGNGANELDVMRFLKSGVSLGDGNNNLAIKVLEGSTMRLGHGDNSVYIALLDQEIQSGNNIETGNGNNSFRFGMVTHNYTEEASRFDGARNNHTFQFGEGANTVSFRYASLQQYFENGFAGKYSGNVDIIA